MDIGYTHALDYLEAQMDKTVKNAGRNALIENREHDTEPVRYARIPEANACKFCQMLGSRGFVYRSRKTAGEFSEWHPHCNCQIVPAFGVSLDRSNSRIDWRTTRSGRSYTQEQVSVRGTEYEAFKSRPEEIDRVISKQKERFDAGEITEEEFNQRVKNAREALQNYDPDKLYEEYKSWGKSFRQMGERHKTLTPNQATKETMEALADEYKRLLEEAASTNELNQVWVRVCTSTNKEELAMAYYDELRTAYRASKYAQFKQAIPR